MKIPSLLPQTTRSAINTQTLFNAHVPLLPCLGSAGSVGSLGTFAGTGLRVKDSVTIIGSSSGGNNTSSSGSNSLSISNVSASFGNSVPDPGGSGGQIKNVESMSPPTNVGHKVPVSPLREYHVVHSLWVKIDLSFLSRIPGQVVEERTRDGSAGRDKVERQKLTKGERQEEDNEQLVKDRERQGDGDRLTDTEKQTDKEDSGRFAFGEREKVAVRDRERACHGLGSLDNTPVQERSNPRQGGRTESVENGGKHRRQGAANITVPTEKHKSKNKRKHKVGISSWNCLHISPQAFCGLDLSFLHCLSFMCPSGPWRIINEM